MPKPLGPQPDSVPVHEQVRELMRKAHTDRMAPIGIVFSQAGYAKAMGQSVPGMQPFTGDNSRGKLDTHYLGPPFTISTSLTTGDVLLDLVPGGSAEAKAFRAAKRAALSPEQQRLESVNHTFASGRSAIRTTAKGPMDRPTIEVLAEGLTLVQLSDLIVAWCDANPREAIVDSLRDTVAKHGRFE